MSMLAMRNSGFKSKRPKVVHHSRNLLRDFFFVATFCVIALCPMATWALDVALTFDANPAFTGTKPSSIWATGSMDSWSGWGLELKDPDGDGIYVGTFTGLTEGGNYEFAVLPSGNGWSGKITPPTGSSCDFDPSDEYNNYGFVASSSSPSISLCSNCCSGGSGLTPAPVPTTVDCWVYFDAKPTLGSTGLPSSLWATGDKDSWSGWGVQLLDADGDGVYAGKFDQLTPGTAYEFLVLPSGGGWSSSMSPPLGSSCDFDPTDSYNNYGFTAADKLSVHISSDCSAHASNWELVWSDEFSSYDSSSWTSSGFGDAPWQPDNNAWGGGNSELQFYTSRNPDNIVVADGKLKIIAKQETFSGEDCPAFNFACSDSEKISVTREYTSARLHTPWCGATSGFKYGKFEMRAKMPRGPGAWPAFWLMPVSPTCPYIGGSRYGGWPTGGEIDIAEFGERVRGDVSARDVAASNTSRFFVVSSQGSRARRITTLCTHSTSEALGAREDTSI